MPFGYTGDMGGFPNAGVPQIVNPRTGLPFGFHPSFTRMIASGDETSITLKADPYDNVYVLTKNNAALDPASLIYTPRNIALPAAATVGDVYTLYYLARGDRAPTPSILSANSPLDNWFSAGGLGLWITVNSGTTCYQDTAKTTLAVADGDPVRCVVMHRGPSIPDFVAPSDAARPILKFNATLGRWYLQFTAASTMSLAPASGAASDWKWLHDGTEWCLAAKLQMGTISNPNAGYMIVSTDSGSSGSTGMDLFYDDRSGSGFNDRFRMLISNTVGTFTINADGGDSKLTPNAVHTISVAANPSVNASLYVDTVNTVTASVGHVVSTGNPTGTMHIGIGGNGSLFPATMNLYGLAILRGTGAGANRTQYEAQI